MNIDEELLSRSEAETENFAAKLAAAVEAARTFKYNGYVVTY